MRKNSKARFLFSAMLLFTVPGAINIAYANNLDITLAIPQQQREVKGNVSDINGETIIGASVMVKGSTSGTITDMDGNFLLRGVNNGDVIVISYVGYVTQEIKYAGQAVLHVTLKEDTEMLDEVVVVAYGTTVKRKMTQAVSSVNVKQIEDLGGYANIASAMQGRTPGVFITNSSGALGATPGISIRGNDAPMYVIDGVVQDAETFNRLNSQDIESLTVMKDATSAAVYGAQAGDGIIVVKTKSGTRGKTSINYTFDQQWNVPTLTNNNVTSAQYAQAVRDADYYSGSNIDSHYTQQDVELFFNGTDPLNHPNVSWRDALLKKSSSSQRHSLTMDGGNENTQYRMSLGYYYQGSLIRPINGKDPWTLNRYNIGLNANHRFSQIGLLVGMDIKASLDESKGKNESGVMSIANNHSTEKIYNLDGTYFANTPFITADPRSGYIKKKKPIINARINAEWDVIGVKGMKATFMGNYRSWNEANKDWADAYVPTYTTGGAIVPATKSPILTMRKDDGFSYEMNIGLSYARSIGKHTFDISGYYNQRYQYSEWIQAKREKYLSSAVDEIFAGPASTSTNDGGASEKGRLGYIGVLNYDYAGKYILGASFRYDGSDNYMPGKRWGFFPSVSVGYVISDENFMESIRRITMMNLLKFRFAYGEAGVEGGRLAYFQNWSLGDGGFDVNAAQVSAINTPGLISTALTWYTKKSYNAGIDFSFLDNRLSGSIDYFVNDTKGYIIKPLSSYKTPLGTDLPQIMSDDKFRRAGTEMQMRWKDSLGELKYEIGGNVAFYDQTWSKKDQDATIAANPLQSQVNKTLSDGSRMFISNGLYQSAGDLINNPRGTWNNNIRTGNIMYVDVNGDGRIDSNETTGGDFVYNNKRGHATMQYGIDFALAYKGFFLNGLFQGAGNNWKLIGARGMSSGVTSVYYDYQLDYWTPNNTDARYPILDPGTGNANDIVRNNTFWLVNCAYLRLKSLQIGYDFKHKLLKNVTWLSNAKLSIVGQNLFTLSDATRFMDPEQGNTENYGYPITKTYSIVLNIGF